ncbi:Chromosome I, complete genome, related [Eimeria tenella]|uniref:Chromosome I, complete genome, related n=1 Tax=Eimeria tenella TaxID=5802 RepID=U6LB18_EIMTE|nr:Chromosome I, complete genome, related [Eimeria tenella]CDJ44920.1 Chromosome I, complete genome, related [Eimeria tenella]|eukprot:XP_013235667.1 Chromosome I, complete genome, related [Eimeria tenella]
MLAANAPNSSKKSGQIVCTMRPLLECLQQHQLKPPSSSSSSSSEQQQKLVPDGDISQCAKEVYLFEKTCSKTVGYVHDRDGLEDTRSGLFSGTRAL